MNKILVKLYVPAIEQQYELWIPLNKQIYNVISLVSKAVYDFSGGYYNPSKMPLLYDASTGRPYDINLRVIDTNIRNATELILM